MADFVWRNVEIICTCNFIIPSPSDIFQGTSLYFNIHLYLNNYGWENDDNAPILLADAYIHGAEK